VEWILEMMHERDISYVTFEEDQASLKLYDDVLELQDGGTWTYKPVQA